MRTLLNLSILLLTACSSAGTAGTATVVNGDAGSRSPDPVPGRSDSNPPRDPSGACERIEVGAHLGQTPRVMIVLDRSGSMAGQPWSEPQQAVRAIVSGLDDRVEFGLATFPDIEVPRIPGFPGGGPIGFPGRLGPEEACSTGSVDVDPALGAEAAIDSRLRQAVPMGNTPTAATLRAVAGAAAQPDVLNQRVILVTDGAPNCPAEAPTPCRCTNGALSCPPEQCLDSAAVAAVGEIAALGAPVYVVGFRASGYTDILDAMAVAGTTQAYIPAGNASQLTEALRTITGEALPCSYELEAMPVDLSYVRVTLDGVAVDHASLNSDGGWRIQGDRTIELIGTACEALQDTTRGLSLEITVECDQVQLI